MAGLGKGHVYDDWHPTKKYLPTDKEEIKRSLDAFNDFVDSNAGVRAIDKLAAYTAELGKVGLKAQGLAAINKQRS